MFFPAAGLRTAVEFLGSPAKLGAALAPVAMWSRAAAVR